MSSQGKLEDSKLWIGNGVFKSWNDFNSYFISLWSYCKLVEAPPSSLKDSTMSPKVTTTKGERVGRIPWFTTLRDKGVCWSSEMRLGQMTSGSIIHVDLHKANNKLVSAKLEHLLLHKQTTGKHELTRFTTT